MRGPRLVSAFAVILSAGLLTSCADQAPTAPLVVPEAPRADPIVAFEACPRAYWKQSQHYDSWPAGYFPQQFLESVFDVPDDFALDRATFADALEFGGSSGLAGPARILLRAAVAALLNATSPDIDYPRTTAEVIAEVNAALAAGALGDRQIMLALAANLEGDSSRRCPLD